mmetsp:Transcript_49710/g.82502  ORF Transcript_49710/g.82502 Transcript_49710/m.82502 type:complete len:193 (+) Transcript_49710:253-831(+)
MQASALSKLGLTAPTAFTLRHQRAAWLIAEEYERVAREISQARTIRRTAVPQMSSTYSVLCRQRTTSRRRKAMKSLLFRARDYGEPCGIKLSDSLEQYHRLHCAEVLPSVGAGSCDVAQSVGLGLHVRRARASFRSRARHLQLCDHIGCKRDKRQACDDRSDVITVVFTFFQRPRFCGKPVNLEAAGGCLLV